MRFRFARTQQTKKYRNREKEAKKKMLARKCFRLELPTLGNKLRLDFVHSLCLTWLPGERSSVVHLCILLSYYYCPLAV